MWASSVKYNNFSVIKKKKKKLLKGLLKEIWNF